VRENKCKIDELLDKRASWVDDDLIIDINEEDHWIQQLSVELGRNGGR
jgi:hypothetical protein